MFYFAAGSEDPVDGEFYIGSADWMHRNLHNRVELIAPIAERKLREKLWDFIDILLKDNRQAWVLNSDGTYTQKVPAQGEEERGTHQMMMNATINREKSIT